LDLAHCHISIFSAVCKTIFLFASGPIGQHQSTLMGKYVCDEETYNNRPYYTKLFGNKTYYLFYSPDGKNKFTSEMCKLTIFKMKYFTVWGKYSFQNGAAASKILLNGFFIWKNLVFLFTNWLSWKKILLLAFLCLSSASEASGKLDILLHKNFAHGHL